MIAPRVLLLASIAACGSRTAAPVDPALRAVRAANRASCDGATRGSSRCNASDRGIVHLELVATANHDADVCLVRRPHAAYTVVGACLETLRTGTTDEHGILREACLPDDHYFLVVDGEAPQIVEFTYNSDAADPSYAAPVLTPAYPNTAYCESLR